VHPDLAVLCSTNHRLYPPLAPVIRCRPTVHHTPIASTQAFQKSCI
jgi:hypothetical protein